MKTKIVLWGKNENEEKILIAAELVTKEAKVVVYTFPVDQVTEGFANQMMREWRNNKEVPFPEGVTKYESELTMASSFLPENIKADRDDLIQRAQTEWQFIVLSQKLKANFESELEDLKEKIIELKEFDSKIWEELKGFWNRVQHQVRDRNLFREHANNLRDRTNELFAHLKEKRREMDAKLEEKSKEFVKTFNAKLEEIDQKIDDGLSLQPIFEELKKIQKSFREATLSRHDRSKIWDRIDKAFKRVKEKRYGSVNKNKSPLDRIQRRYSGLIQAISKMEKSIHRDETDLQFEQKRVEDTQGQLEAQIRQAKVKMIEERIRSKREKLTEMLKTKEQLEAKIKVEKKRQAAREEQEKIKEAKKEIKEKIAEEIKQAAEARKELEDKIEKAANRITKNEEEKTKEDSDEGSRAKESEAESILSAAGSAIGESLEDVADTISAVAKVVGDKISEVVDDLTQSDEEE